jgi:hypothetical protein
VSIQQGAAITANGWRRAELPLALAIVAVTALWARQIQGFQVFRYWDSDEYFRMAQQFAAGEPVSAAAPYVYRVLTPWVVARCCADDLQQGFLLTNLAAGAALALLLVFWLRRFVDSAAIRLLMVAAYAMQWHAPVRFSFYYPGYVDPLFQVFLVAALLVGDHFVSRPTFGVGVLYVLLIALGSLARETMLLAPLAGLVAAIVVWRRHGVTPALWFLAAMAAGLLSYLTVQSLTSARGGYSFVEALLTALATKPVEALPLSWFIAFGPMLAIVAYDWRATLAFLRERPDLATVLAACLVLGYTGGTDTERFVFWAMPVTYLLIARSIERHRAILAAPGVALLVVAGQVISERVLWPVPNPGSAVTPLSDVAGLPASIYAVANRVFVIDDFHWNLWSTFGSRPFHLVQLAFYLGLSAAIIAAMRRRAASQGLAA